MSSRSKPFNSWLHRGWGLGLWPRLSDHLGRGAWRRAFPAQFPTPPYAALVLHPCPPVNVASIITAHVGAWGGSSWVAPPQNQAAGTRLVDPLDLMGRGSSTFYLFFFKT